MFKHRSETPTESSPPLVREWGVKSRYGSLIIYADEQDARDQLRRTDSLVSRLVGEWRRES